MSGWAWDSPGNQAALAAMTGSRAYVMDALLVSEALVSYGFTIGVLGCRIGFTIGKVVMRTICSVSYTHLTLPTICSV
eukprot:1591966-Prymnesium_polylepis.1